MQNIEKELNQPGVVYEVLSAEDHPDVVTRYPHSVFTWYYRG